MPDDEGYSLPGELPLGSYSSMEGDLGDSLMGPLGFSIPEEEEAESFGFTSPGHSTVPAVVSYLVKS